MQHRTLMTSRVHSTQFGHSQASARTSPSSATTRTPSVYDGSPPSMLTTWTPDTSQAWHGCGSAQQQPRTSSQCCLDHSSSKLVSVALSIPTARADCLARSSVMRPLPLNMRQNKHHTPCQCAGTSQPHTFRLVYLHASHMLHDVVHELHVPANRAGQTGHTALGCSAAYRGGRPTHFGEKEVHSSTISSRPCSLPVPDPEFTNT